MKKITRISMSSIAMAASMAILLTGCGNGTGSNGSSNTTKTAEKPVNGGTLTIAQTTKWTDEFVPMMDASQYTMNVWGLSFDSLMNVNNKLEFVPWLMSSYKWSADHKTVTCTLDPNAKWSDGQPIVSDDVLLFMNFVASKAYNTKLNGQYEYLVDTVVGAQDIVKGKKTSFAQTGGYKKISDKEFQVTFNQADAASVTSYIATWVPLPSHKLANIPFDQWLTMSYDKQPDVVSGAFIPTSVNGADNVVYKSNPNYWKGKPHIDQVVMNYVSEDVAPSLLQSGKADLLLNGLKPADYVKLESSKTVVPLKEPDLGFNYLGLRDDNPLFSDARVRQAMEYAINRPAMIKGVYKGLAATINSPVPSVSWAAAGPNDGLNTYDYSPDKAKQLLDQAGYTAGSDGWRIDPKTGKKATLHLTYSSGSPTVQLLASEVQQDLKAVGLDVELNPPIDFSTMFSKLENNDKSIEMWLAAWGLSVDPDPRGLWGSHDSMNYEHYVDPHIDELIKNTWALPDDFTQDGRKKQFIPFELYVNQKLPLVFLLQRDDLYAYNKRVHIPAEDWTSASQIPLNLQDWWVTAN